jgi:hypothetical protein
VSRDAAFAGVNLSSFDRRRLQRVGFSREVSRDGAFSGVVSLSSFDRQRLQRVGFSREVSRDAAFSGVSLSDFDRRRPKGVAFSREVSRRDVGPFADTDLTVYE